MKKFSTIKEIFAFFIQDGIVTSCTDKLGIKIIPIRTKQKLK